MLRQTAGLYKTTIDPNTAAGDVSGWKRGKALSMLGVNYRWSPLVLEERMAIQKDVEMMKAHSYGGYEDGLAAGDRAPEAPGLVSTKDGTETSLFKIFDMTQHTVLVFPSRHESDVAPKSVSAVLRVTDALVGGTVQTVMVSRSAAAKPFDICLCDRDGHAHDAYFIQDDTLTVVIIRPDAYIGGIVHSAEGVTRYFANIFGHR